MDLAAGESADQYEQAEAPAGLGGGRHLQPPRAQRDEYASITHTLTHTLSLLSSAAVMLPFKIRECPSSADFAFYERRGVLGLVLGLLFLLGEALQRRLGRRTH